MHKPSVPLKQWSVHRTSSLPDYGQSSERVGDMAMFTNEFGGWAAVEDVLVH